ELVNYLCDGFNTAQRIRFQVEVETISLDVGIAIPLGLILNEAITNSIKYAFPENSGVITISLVESDDRLILTIADDGIGLPPDFDSLKPNSLGMRLMQGLSKEIDASFKIKSKSGTIISIVFTDDSVLRRLQITGSAENSEAIA
ncbi:MAG TPA: sensor histidine kinase, partial [Cyclobacteriaceae bacterium]